MATHSSVLAWRIPGMGEPGGLPSMGSHRVGHDWSDLAAAGLSFLIGKEIWARWSWLTPILDPSINISYSQEITSNQQLCSHFSSLHLISRMQVKTSTEFSFFLRLLPPVHVCRLQRWFFAEQRNSVTHNVHSLLLFSVLVGKMWPRAKSEGKDHRQREAEQAPVGKWN